MSLRVGLRFMARPPFPALYDVEEAANILSAYNLCSFPSEFQTASLASAYSLSIAEVRLVAILASAALLFTYQSVHKETASLASVYNLSTAET